MLAERRPDLRVVHFSHTPFAGPDWLRVLPDAVAAELLEGLAGHHACGFHTRRWADAFAAELPARSRAASPAPSWPPLAPDPDDLAQVAGSDACAEAPGRARAARSATGR